MALCFGEIAGIAPFALDQAPSMVSEISLHMRRHGSRPSRKSSPRAAHDNDLT